MKRKVRVWFDIEPKLKFTTEERYPNLNIISEYKDSKLIGLQVDVEVNLNDNDEIVKDMARYRIIRLIERIQYLTKMNLKAEIKRIQQIDPLSVKSTGYKSLRVSAILVKHCSMPKEDDLLYKQDKNTTYQLMYYNRGIRADDVSEKIKNFYLVIEKEKDINGSYSILGDLKNTRIAVSHTILTNQRAKNFLMNNISSDSIDFNNPSHVKFLHTMLPKFKEEAEKILDKKVY